MSAEESVALRESRIQEEYLRAARESAPLPVWHDVIARFPRMKAWVARNKTVPVDILAVLATDDDSDVRRVVAKKNSLTLDLMLLLSRDRAEDVRMRIAYKKNVPIDILKHLSGDQFAEVSAAAQERLVRRERAAGPELASQIIRCRAAVGGLNCCEEILFAAAILTL